jgi:hypothetical protein
MHARGSHPALFLAGWAIKKERRIYEKNDFIWRLAISPSWY